MIPKAKMMPKPRSSGEPSLPAYAPVNVGMEIPFPTMGAEQGFEPVVLPAFPDGISDVTTWGMTVVAFGQFKDKEMSYDELVRSEDSRCVSYVKWCRSRTNWVPIHQYPCRFLPSTQRSQVDPKPVALPRHAMPYLSPVGILGIGYLLQLGSCSLSIRPLASNEDQQIIRLRQQVKQQKHRLHELQQSLGRRAARASRGAGASKKAPQSPSNPMAPVHALSSEGRFSEAKVSLAAAQVPRDAMMTQVDEMRWQMGLQLNCSAADWLNSTADSAIFWSKDGRKLSQLLAILLAAAIVTSLGLFGFKTSLRTAVVRPPESETAALETETAAVVKAEGGDGMWRLQPHWQEGEDRSSESSSDESKVQRSVSGSNGSNASKAESGSNFLGDDFGCQGDDDGTAVAEMRAEGVLEPGEVETQEIGR
eukprot:s1480_g11.t1